MSESEGLVKLTEYLKQTRRQAETAIDHLNGQLSILKDENSQLNQVIHDLQLERDHYRSQLEQIQQNPSKWKFKERDEWKALVDSIQADRSRLQEENALLLAQIEGDKNEIATLKDTVELLNEDRLLMQSQLNEQSPLLTGNTTGNGSEDMGTNTSSPRSPVNQMLLSPIVDRHGREMSFFSESPRSIARQLKHELKRAYDQIDEERKMSENEKRSQLAEINRLKGKLIYNNQAETAREIIGTEVVDLGKDQSKETQTSWLGSWFGIIFPGSNSNKDIHSPTILQV